MFVTQMFVLLPPSVNPLIPDHIIAANNRLTTHRGKALDCYGSLAELNVFTVLVNNLSSLLGLTK